MQSINQSRAWKYMLAGTLAGASGAIGLMIAVTIGLGVGLIWQYAYFRNIVVLNDRATTTMIEDVGRIPAISLGVTLDSGGNGGQRHSAGADGTLCAALSTAVAQSDHLRIVLLAVVGAVVISVLLTQTDRSLYSDISRAEGSGLPSLQELQNSVWYLLMIAIALALGIGGALWLYWSWWYAHWRRWMRLDAAVAPKDAPETSSDDWFTRRQARERSQRMILLLFAGSVLFTIAAVGRLRICSHDDPKWRPIRGADGTRCRSPADDRSADPRAGGREHVWYRHGHGHAAVGA